MLAAFREPNVVSLFRTIDYAMHNWYVYWCNVALQQTNQYSRLLWTKLSLKQNSCCSLKPQKHTTFTAKLCHTWLQAETDHANLIICSTFTCVSSTWDSPSRPSNPYS